MEVPVNPPARILLREQNHEAEGEKEAAPAARQCVGRRLIVGVKRLARQRAEHDENRDGDDDPEGRREPIKRSGGNVDVEVDGVAAYHAASPLLNPISSIVARQRQIRAPLASAASATKPRSSRLDRRSVRNRGARKDAGGPRGITTLRTADRAGYPAHRD